MRELLLRMAIVLAFVLAALLNPSRSYAQISYENGLDTIFAHSETSRFWVSGQANAIFQWHPHFHAKYGGAHSFRRSSEQALSEVATLYTGLELGGGTEILADIENAGGRGLSQTEGIAGYTNADAVRSPSLGAEPYVARLELRKLIALSEEKIGGERGPLSLTSSLPARRLDIHIGRFSTVDFFDVNSVGSDSHMQFMNWAVVNNGAYDYAADTRGYTWGGVIDFEDRWWGLRFGEALLSKRANGLNLQKNLQDAHSENYELEVRPSIIADRKSTIRLLAFTNYANMGDYRDALNLFRQGKAPLPDITAHPRQVAAKYGFGVNTEQEFTSEVRGFVRAGWNEGQHESWNYTEIDQTGAIGVDFLGTLWNRARDKIGIAFVINGISRRHREYLANGGLGFILGDGNLTYGPEKIMECYYNLPLPLLHGVYGALDVEYVDNPGYNRDRGPAVIPGVRLHAEL